MFSIAIPSYNRSQSIKNKTLAMLDSYLIPHTLIKVFVQPDELHKYRASLPEDIEVIEGAAGCIENRNAIRQYFPEGHDICYIDDDIHSLWSVCDQTHNHDTCHHHDKKNLKESYYKKQIPLPSLHRFLIDAFKRMKAEGAHLGGIYPICNGFFASHRVNLALNYICGYFYLERNVKDIALQGHQYAEDFERSCIFYRRDGKVCRFEWIMAKSGFYKGEGDNGPGGLVESRTVERSKIAQETLAGLYPEYVKVVPPTKGNKYWNLKILKQTNQNLQ